MNIPLCTIIEPVLRQLEPSRDPMSRILNISVSEHHIDVFRGFPSSVKQHQCGAARDDQLMRFFTISKLLRNQLESFDDDFLRKVFHVTISPPNRAPLSREGYQAGR